MFQGSRGHVWWVATLPDSAVLDSNSPLKLGQLLASLPHQAVAPSSLLSPLDTWQTCPGNKERDRTLVFTDVFTSAFNHGMCQTQHVAKCWLLHCTVSQGGIERCAISHYRKSTHHLWHFSVLRYLGLATHSLCFGTTSFNSVCSGNVGFIFIIS